MPLAMRPPRLWRLCAALLLTTYPLRAAQDDAPDNRSSRVDYVLRADVVPLERDLTGSATITWTNRTADTVSDLWFHLHLNAYSNNRSTHLWQSRGVLRGVEMTDGWGWQRVDTLAVGGQDLLPSLAWEETPGGRAEDRTVFSVDLPEPVAPGASVVVELAWTSKLPRVRRRTGVKDDFVFLSHWFPKLGVYEGGRGWNCHQFHMNTEFYSNFGTYDVTLTLPEEYDGKVGTSGAPAGPAEVADGRVTQRFHAPALEDLEYVDHVASVAAPTPLVHGFAWTADPEYHVHEERFSFDEWRSEHAVEVAEAEAAFGMDPGTLTLREVDVRVLIQPERKDQAARHARATEAALFFYGLWFGEYPYSTVTVVDPAWGASAAGGMEYPTLFTCGTSMFTRQRMHRPESVTVHEAGHQFWYGLVGNNEYEAAWLDEGFNSYADSEVLARVFGKRRGSTRYAGLPFWGSPTAGEPSAKGLAGILSGQRWEVAGQVFAPLAPSPFVDLWRDQPWLTFGEDQTDPRWNDRSSYLGNPDADPVHTPAFAYQNRSSYRVNSYPRPAVVLRTLSGVVGEAAFMKGMRHYSGEWRYRHPYPEDFYASFQEGAGLDVAWYFDDLFGGTGVVDWGVEVDQHKTPKPAGLFLEDGEFVEPDGDVEPDDLWRYDVVVTRSGTLRLPLTVEVAFADGETRRYEWSREAQADTNWWRLPIEPGAEKVRQVLLDPERVYFIDTNMTDNQWYDRPDKVAPLRWSERAWTQYTHLLHWYSTLGG